MNRQTPTIVTKTKKELTKKQRTKKAEVTPMKSTVVTRAQTKTRMGKSVVLPSRTWAAIVNGEQKTRPVPKKAKSKELNSHSEEDGCDSSEEATDVEDGGGAS